MAKQIDPKYAADDLPKVKNPFLYAYRTIAKLLVYLLFVYNRNHPYLCNVQNTSIVHFIINHLTF